MNRKLLPVLLICGAFLPAEAMCQEAKDTVKTTPAVTVEADRAKEKRLNSARPVTLITKTEIRQSGAGQVQELLTRTPGVFIRNYGGSGGMKLFSLRGSNSQQSVILLDGVRFSGTQSGTLDLSTIPVSMLGEIEILRGGASAFFGGNAMAGALNLRSLRAEERFSAGAMLTLASFGEVLASAHTNIPLDTGGLFFSLEHSRSKGDFPFPFSQFGEERTLRRENGDFGNSSLLGTGTVHAGLWKLSPMLLLRTTERGIPGAVVQGRIENRGARYAEDEGFFHLGAERNFISSRLNLALSAKINRTRYKDPELRFYGPEGYNEAFLGRDVFLQASWLGYGESYLWEIKGEGGLSTLEGEMLQPDAGNYVSRRSMATALRGEKVWGSADLLFRFEPALRIDYFSDMGAAVSPLVSFLASGADFPVRARGQWSYNFRAPNFNEMYYLNYGNSGLRPERSHSFSAGFVYAEGDLSLEADGFFIASRDQIVSVPRSPVAWSAQNLGFVVTRGVELRATAEFFGKRFRMDCAYTFQRASDETAGSYGKGLSLPYIPRNIISVHGAWSFASTRIGAEFSFTGQRYSLAGEEAASLLTGFSTGRLFAFHTVEAGPVRFALNSSVENLFDERYSVIANYPMPGRSFRIGISTDYRAADSP